MSDSVVIGEKMASQFEDTLPDGFHKPVHMQVHTMEIMKKGLKVGDQTIYKLEKLYGRLLVISTKRNMPLQVVFSFELAPLPSSLFDEYGLMRKSSKSSFVPKLCVLITEPPPVDVQLVDGNELLYHTTLPKIGTSLTLFNNVVEAAHRKHPVFVIFDKYNKPISIKTQEREREMDKWNCIQDVQALAKHNFATTGQNNEKFCQQKSTNKAAVYVQTREKC